MQETRTIHVCGCKKIFYESDVHLNIKYVIIESGDTKEDMVCWIVHACPNCKKEYIVFVSRGLMWTRHELMEALYGPRTIQILPCFFGEFEP